MFDASCGGRLCGRRRARPPRPGADRVRLPRFIGRVAPALDRWRTTRRSVVAPAPARAPAPTARWPEQPLQLHRLSVVSLERLLVPCSQQLGCVRPPPWRQLVASIVAPAQLAPGRNRIATRPPVARLGLADPPFVPHVSPLRIPTTQDPSVNHRTRRPPVDSVLRPDPDHRTSCLLVRGEILLHPYGVIASPPPAG